MKKLLVAACVVALVLAFTITALAPSSNAARPCIATCLNGTLLVCCPVGGGQWECHWDGPCDWGPIF